jgi:hypothetical protein
MFNHSSFSVKLAFVFLPSQKSRTGAKTQKKHEVQHGHLDRATGDEWVDF